MDFDELWKHYFDATPEEWVARGGGWSMARILADLRAWGGTEYELTGQDLADVANIIAAELEARGLEPTVIEHGEPDFRRAAPALADLVAAIEKRDSQRGRLQMATLDLPTLTDCGCKARVYGDGSGVDIDYCPLHSQAPAMLGLLRQLLALYDGQRLAPPDDFVSYWRDVRELIRQAEAWG